MFRLRLAIGAAVSLIVAVSAEAKPYLLSIRGIPFADSERVDSFSLETWGITFKAVCRIPADWEITVRGAGVGGRLSGEAGHGAAYLGRRDLKHLSALAVVDVDGPIVRAQRGPVPPTFSGSADIYIGSKDRTRRVRLSYANVELAPATRCP